LSYDPPPFGDDRLVGALGRRRTGLLSSFPGSTSSSPGATAAEDELFTHRDQADDDTDIVDDTPYYDEADESPRSAQGHRPQVVRTFGELFITAGLVILLFVVYEVYWTDLISAGKQTQATPR